MTRIEFIRSAGRWSMLLFILATGGFLLVSRRISFRNYCAANTECAACGLSRVCKTADEKTLRSDEKK